MTQNQDSGNNLRQLGEVIEDTGRPIKAKAQRE